jgi:hypothetical protein
MRNQLICLLFLSSLLFFSCEEDQLTQDDYLSEQIQATEGKKLGKDKGFPKTRVFYAELSALNDSGVEGYVTLTINGNDLTVEVNASGLEDGKSHMQHIHGFEDTKANATCPPPSADLDGNGLITISEGAPYYGPVLQPLSPFPTSATIDYERTFNLANMDNEDYFDLRPIQNRVIVLHGKTLDDGNYRPLLPVACGEIKPLPASQ